MSEPDKLRDPAAALAEGFARQAARWARPEEAARVAAAARQLSLATSAGHVCITLQAIAAELGPEIDASTLRGRLLASGVVGTHDAPGTCPMVLDAADRLYLHRLFDFECRLARRIVAASRQPPDPLDDNVAGLLASMFDAPTDGAADWQRVAAALALRQRLVVISGGPGTGKTTTVVSVIAGLLARHSAARIALAAPTGKAAARMTEAIRSRADRMPEALRQRLPAEAFTVHRLLGASPDGFRHHAGNPLPLDALVVDEASMLDLELATRLFEAMPASARIVLLGDKDQLAAVESGAVFAELGADPSLGERCRFDIAAAAGCVPDQLTPPSAVRSGALQDLAVWFVRNYRFGEDSRIGRAAAAIRDGRADALLALLGEADGDELAWIDGEPGRALEPAVREALQAGYAPYLEALRRNPRDVAAVSAAFGRFRALCATREGPRGVRAINDHVTRELRAALGLGSTRGARWFAGQPLMVLRNDPGLQLFNGDIGLVLPGQDGELAAMFPASDGRWRALSPLRLPAHETAFAMTVHKSQGSEFDEVLLLMPEGGGRVASRELLYTGVTRARRQVTLAASAASLRAAVARPTRRESGLADRLHEALAAAA